MRFILYLYYKTIDRIRIVRMRTSIRRMSKPSSTQRRVKT